MSTFNDSHNINGDYNSNTDNSYRDLSTNYITNLYVIIANGSVEQLKQILRSADPNAIADACKHLHLPAGNQQAAINAARKGDSNGASNIILEAGRAVLRESTRALSAEAGGRKCLRSVHGSYLSAPEPGTEVELAHVAPGYLENWYIEDWGAKVVLKARGAPNKPGRFLQAHPNGRVDLSYAHPKQCERQMWKPFQNDDGTWSLLSIHGRWLSARKDGSLCTVSNCDSWEHFSLERW